MLKRTITGLLILLVVVGFIALRYVHIAFFDLFTFGISLIATYEIIKCITSGENKKELVKFLPYTYVSLTFLVYLLSSFDIIKSVVAILIEILLIITIFAVSFIYNLFYLKKLQKTNKTINNSELISTSLNTMLVVLYPGIFTSFLYKINDFGLNLGMIAIIMVFAVSMSTDVFAYLLGTLTHGKGPRLCPQISPKKGIIGMISGTLFGVIAGLCGYFAFAYSDVIESVILNLATYKSVIMFLLIGLFGAILTQVGDLVASSVKRNHAIKDYGNIFPGHGGVMDRIDGLMFNVVSVYIIMIIFLI